jgi:putative oxidoreductase
MDIPTICLQSAAPLAARVLLASFFIFGGIEKLSNPGGTQAYIASVGLPFPVLGYIVALVIEIGGGTLLLVGFEARSVASVLAVFTVTSAIFFDHSFGDQDQFIHILRNWAITCGLLQVVAFGGGGLSLDKRRPAISAQKLARGYLSGPRRPRDAKGV